MVYKSVFVFSWYQNYILFNAFAVKIGNYTLAFIFLSIDNLFVSIKFSPNTDFFISAQLAKIKDKYIIIIYLLRHLLEFSINLYAAAYHAFSNIMILQLSYVQRDRMLYSFAMPDFSH